MNCPKGHSNTWKASKLAYIDGTWFCADCADYYPSKTLAEKLNLDCWA